MVKLQITTAQSVNRLIAHYHHVRAVGDAVGNVFYFRITRARSKRGEMQFRDLAGTWFTVPALYHGRQWLECS